MPNGPGKSRFIPYEELEATTTAAPEKSYWDRFMELIETPLVHHSSKMKKALDVIAQPELEDVQDTKFVGEKSKGNPLGMAVPGEITHGAKMKAFGTGVAEATTRPDVIADAVTTVIPGAGQLKAGVKFAKNAPEYLQAVKTAAKLGGSKAAVASNLVLGAQGADVVADAVTGERSLAEGAMGALQAVGAGAGLAFGRSARNATKAAPAPEKVIRTVTGDAEMLPSVADEIEKLYPLPEAGPDQKFGMNPQVREAVEQEFGMPTDPSTRRAKVRTMDVEEQTAEAERLKEALALDVPTDASGPIGKDTKAFVKGKVDESTAQSQLQKEYIERTASNEKAREKFIREQLVQDTRNETAANKFEEKARKIADQARAEDFVRNAEDSLGPEAVWTEPNVRRGANFKEDGVTHSASQKKVAPPPPDDGTNVENALGSGGGGPVSRPDKNLPKETQKALKTDPSFYERLRLANERIFFEGPAAKEEGMAAAKRLNVGVYEVTPGRYRLIPDPHAKPEVIMVDPSELGPLPEVKPRAPKADAPPVTEVGTPPDKVKAAQLRPREELLAEAARFEEQAKTSKSPEKWLAKAAEFRRAAGEEPLPPAPIKPKKGPKGGGGTPSGGVRVGGKKPTPPAGGSAKANLSPGEVRGIEELGAVIDAHGGDLPVAGMPKNTGAALSPEELAKAQDIIAKQKGIRVGAKTPPPVETFDEGVARLEANPPAHRSDPNAPGLKEVAQGKAGKTVSREAHTPEEWAELEKIAAEMGDQPFVPRQWNPDGSPDVEVVSGNLGGRGNKAKVVERPFKPGAGGAKVFDDIQQAGSTKAKTRAQVEKGINDYLAGKNNVWGARAMDVAKARLAKAKAWAPASEPVDDIAEAMPTLEQNPLDDVFPDSLAAEADQIDNAGDVLDTGEVQSRLPEAGAVRDLETPTPEMEAPFSLTPEVSKAPDAVEGDLFSSAARSPIDEMLAVTDEVPTESPRGIIPVDSLKKTPNQVAGEHYQNLRAERLASGKPKGSPIEKGERVAGDARYRLNKAEKAAEAKKAVDAEVNAENDAFMNMTPEEAKSWLSRRGGEAGQSNPEVAMRATLGAAGALTGGVVAEENDMDPLLGAAVGGAAGALTPTAIRGLIQAANATGDAASNLKAAESVKWYVNKAASILPDYVRASLLYNIPNLPINMWVGPWGSATMGAIESIASGDHTRGFKALKNLLNVVEMGKRYGRGLSEASSQIEQAHSRGEISDALEGLPYVVKKALSGPGELMTAGDIAARNALVDAGYTVDEARAITLTDEPELGFARATRSFMRGAQTEGGKKSVAVRVMLPFHKTALNQFEGALERTPLVGYFANRAKDVAAPVPLQVAQQALGGGVIYGAYEAGYRTPADPATTPILMKLISNAGGQYGMIAAAAFAAGQASAAGKDRSLGDFLKVLARNNPLPTNRPVDEAIQMIEKGAEMITGEGEGIRMPWNQGPSDIPTSIYPQALRPHDVIQKAKDSWRLIAPTADAPEEDGPLF